MFVFRLAMKSRGFTPEEGQKKLEEMNKAVDKDSRGIGVLKLEGITVWKNPFPDWFHDMLKHTFPGIKFDDINYAYMLFDESREKLEEYQNWFYRVYLQWQIDQGIPERTEFSKLVDVNVLDANDDTLDGMKLIGF